MSGHCVPGEGNVFLVYRDWWLQRPACHCLLVILGVLHSLLVAHGCLSIVESQRLYANSAPVELTTKPALNGRYGEVASLSCFV